MTKKRRRNGGKGFGVEKKRGCKRKGYVKAGTQTSAVVPKGLEWKMDVIGLRDPNKLLQKVNAENPSQEGQSSVDKHDGHVYKAPPFKLKIRQSEIIERLIDKYGEEIEKMAMDMKMNPFQLSVGQLKKHIESFHYWGKREVNPNSTLNLKKLRWYNDPLKPNDRRFIARI